MLKKMENQQFWNDFLDNISNKLNAISFNTWFGDAKLIDIKNNNYTILINDTYKKNYVVQYYQDLIEEVLNELTGKNCTFDILSKDDINVEKPVIKEEKNEETKINYNSNLNKNYTFNNFVVGDANRLAQTFALATAEKPGTLYNPLFIYGKSGLGKTHLMHAIGNFIEENSNLKVLYVTSEKFIADFTQINRKDADNFELVKHFKDKYRNIDVLMIDDIQFLGGANKTQDEFFNTFNELYSSNKQIIISSDRSPDDLKILEERLRTRFSMGLTIDILPPDYELRVKILQNKIMGHEVNNLIKDGVLEYIANYCESDVRHLEGAINRLYAYTAMYSPKEITLEFATEALKDYFGNNRYITNSIGKIQKAVADYFELTVENLKSKKRSADINNARQIAMYICKMTTEETLEKIGLEFNRNHATVIHACEKVENDLKNDDDLRNTIKEIKNKIVN